MARELVPIKVDIGIKENGQAKYPDFNTILPAIRHSMDWSKYVDVYGTGWHYDCCGHKEEESGSPHNHQMGMLLVPEDFAIAAIAAFPGVVSALTEAETEDFYDNHVAKNEPDEIIDTEVLQGIKLKKDLGVDLTAQQEAALDPDKEERGIRKNKRKKFVDLKTQKGVTIKSI